jgi:uncharacterized tellurite resistance protein B-like protein
MNMFFRRSINEYQRQISLKESFAIQTERMQSVIEKVNWTKFEESPINRRVLRRRLRLLVLSPLVEIAWADGRVTRRESDAILQVAAAYGLVDDETGYCELLERLTSRPMAQKVERTWREFHRLFENLPELDRQNIAFCLEVQARFVAEQSSDNLMSFLRGERICKNESEALAIFRQQLESAESAAKSREEMRNVAVLWAEKEVSRMPEKAADVYPSEYEAGMMLNDYDKLIPLVPLVKTAWAEGRVTRRERHLVFEAAARMGVKPETTAYKRLEEWLELHPTDEFYDSAFDVLHGHFQTLDADEKSRRKFDLLSDCTRIAEASGGAKNFPSGGARICDEEIAVVKHIAKKLNVAA